MAPWHCCILLVYLLSPLKAEADDREWKEEMEKQLKQVLSIVKEQAQLIKRQNLEITTLKKQTQEIGTLRKRIDVLETMNTLRDETELKLASSIRETETNISHIAEKLNTKEGEFSKITCN